MNWKPKALVAAAGFALLALPAYSQTDRDPMILLHIHQANQDEIEMARLAKTNSSSQEVKNFAHQMIKDHKSAEAQVQTYAKNHKIDLDAVHRRLVETRDDRLELERRARTIGSATGECNLRKLNGAEFDREFTRAMVEDHQAAIDQLLSARSDASDSEVRNLIDELLPTFRQHLSMAQKLSDAVSKA